MRTSTTRAKDTHIASGQHTLARRVLAVLFWLIAWHALSVYVGQDILLVSPIAALRALFRLMGTSAFYGAIVGSFGRILLGFVIALAAGILLAALAFRLAFVDVLLSPLMATIKATPVASFVILALVWISSQNLSIFTSFLMVMPVIYVSTLNGLKSSDRKLLEMADTFALSIGRRVRAIYLPSVYPYFLSACQVALGMCWKAGIAAEVIGQPAGSIGDKLYRAKIFLSTDELFAWTIAIILLSVAFERLAVLGINRLRSYYQGGDRHDV